jgi:hypothetical protein
LASALGALGGVHLRVIVMFENHLSGGRLLGFNVGDWMLLMSGCLVSGFLAFLM